MSVRLLRGAIMMVLFPAVAHSLELTASESGKRVSVSISERLTVTLAGNPTAGYLWELAATDREVLAMEGEPTFAPDLSLPGAGGSFTFRFTPRRQGTANVKLVYRRPWEKGGEPQRTFDLTVAVTDVEPCDNSAGYRSSRGELLKVCFNLSSVRVTLSDGRSVTLPSALSASGARYSDGIETFWEHQGVGRFFKGDTLLFEGMLLDDGFAR